MNSSASRHIWRHFYLLASELYQLGPWDWMFDVDLFGIQDPESKEIGYCGFLGAESGVKGLALFRGSSGLFSFARLVEQNPEQLYLLTSYQLDGLMLTFREVDGMLEEELEYLRSTGMHVSPGSIVPILKDHVPGKMPWKVVHERMVVRMIYTLEQALIVARRFKDDPDLLDNNGPMPDRILVRTPEKKGGVLMWSETWLPEPNLLSEVEKRQANVLLLRSRCQGLPSLQDEWLTDIFYFPRPIDLEGDRPFLPQMALVASVDHQAVIARASFTPGKLEDGGLDEWFVTVVEDLGGLPSAIVATRPESYGYWLPIAEALSLEIQLRSNDPLMEDLKAAEFNSFPI